MLHVQRGAEGGAVVAGGRLDEEVAKEAAALDDAVGRAVQRNAARQAEGAQSGELAVVPQHVQLARLQHRLQRGGDVRVAPLDRALRDARWAEPLGERAS